MNATSTGKRINYGQRLAVMILVAEQMGLEPSLTDQAKLHLEGGAIHPTTSKEMESEAVKANDQLRHDSALIAKANVRAVEIMSEYGLSI